MQNYKAMYDLLWDATAAITKNMINEPSKYIRDAMQVNGIPDWNITDDIIFLNLAELNDDYARQRDSVYTTSGGSARRETVRTRVWGLSVAVYGRSAYDIVNRLRDGFFYADIQRLLENNDVAIIPDLSAPVQATEQYAGKWWNRWNIDFRFNELYRLPAENVGSINSVSLSIRANRP